MEQTQIPTERHNLSPEQLQLIKQTLCSIIESPHFCKSKRYPALLKYVIHHALEGDLPMLKERVIGAEVFGRAADYDSSNDTVVRVAFSDIRRRLGFYFSEHHDAAVRIDLPAGGYAPEFYFCSTNKHLDPPHEALDLAESNEALAVPQPNSSFRQACRSLWRRRWTIPALAVLLLLSGAVLGYWHHQQNRARHEFWWPLLQANQPIVIVVGAVPDQNSAPPAEHVSGEPSLVQRTVSQDASKLMLGNAIATAKIWSVFHETAHGISIIPAQTASINQLRSGPVVLVGALDNIWTARALAPLRYTMHFDPNPADGTIIDRRMVLDRLNSVAAQAWRLGIGFQPPPTRTDYAIVARFHSELNDGMVVVIAGLGPSGTAAAGECSTDPGRMQEIFSQAPKNWQGMNFEVVLQTTIVQGTAGHTQVVGTYFW